MLRLLLIFLACAAASTAAPPNVVIILADDLGYGDPACFNPASKIATPAIDRLAREGMCFRDAHAPGPLCHASRYGLMTGRFPFRIDVSKWPSQPLIGDGETTLPSLLADAGYQTAMVGKWHVGFREKGYDRPLKGGPVDRGFQSFFGIRASTDIPPYFFIRDDRAVALPDGHIDASNSTAQDWSPIQGKFWRQGGIAPDLQLDEVLPRFTREAISVIENRDPAKPLMLYLAFPAPHTPWLPSAEFAGKSKVPLYGDFVEMVDHEIGRVLETLDQAGIAKDTVVIFSSDNGPVWRESDVKKHGHDAAGGLRGMKGDAWEAGHRMPFIVRWPGKVAATSETGRLICFTDLLATFAELLDRDLSAGAAPDSVSFLPTLLGRPQEEREPVFMESAHGFRSIRSGPWKYIDRLGSGGFSEPKEIKPAKDGPRG